MQQGASRFAQLLMLAPAQLLLALFLLLPSLYVGWLSLTDASLGRAGSFVGFANYARLLADPAFWIEAQDRCRRGEQPDMFPYPESVRFSRRFA